EELEAEVAQCAVDRKHDAIDLKNLLISNDNLIAGCLSKENDRFRAENDKVKQHYKQLYESIKITRAKHIEQVTKLTAENVTLKTSVSKAKVQPSVLTRTKHAVDVELIIPRLRNNRDAHQEYLRHLKESVETIHDIVEEAKVVRPLDRSIVSACRYTLHSQELVEQDSNKNKLVVTQKIQKTNVPVPHSTGVKCFPKAGGSQPKRNHKTNRISPAKGDNKLPVKDLPRTNKYHLRTTNRVDSNLEVAFRKHSCYVRDTNGCSKHMTGDRSRLLNFVKKFIGTVRFGNDHFGAIMCYGDYVVGESVISKVYYVEGLGHNLFSLGQFYDFDLEVAFRKHSCYVRDTNGVDLIKGSRGTNLYTILVEDMMKSSPICLLSKASKNKSWLWHRHLNHLNFDTINDLARKDLVRGSPHTVPRTPQQNEVVERRNRTLVEAARTMLILSKAPMFLWAEAVATSCYTQNHSLIHTRHHKTPYELVHNKNPDLTFLRVFGALCYPTNDNKDLGKLQPTADTRIFVGS
nr:integrase, catalytic region, zinc finger, CCHC-type, peptidase aspartic, catalytic [Tanacetum cinerariifolium]